MKKIEKIENQLTFLAEIDGTLINSLRRYLNQILVLAIDEVEIEKNDSSLYDEVIAHRLGLMPIKTEKTVKEDSEGKLKLTTKGKGVVYSGSLKGNVEVAYKNMPLVVLSDEQEIDLNAHVTAGKGVEHTKFSPGILFYRDVFEITMDKTLFEAVKDLCTENDIKERGNKVTITDDKKGGIIDLCEGMAQKNGKEIELIKKGEKVITIESFGQIKPEEMFKSSINTLKKDLLNLNKEIEKKF